MFAHTFQVTQSRKQSKFNSEEEEYTSGGYETTGEANSTVCFLLILMDKGSRTASIPQNLYSLRAKERSHVGNQRGKRWFKSTRAREVNVPAAISFKTGRRENYNNVNVSLLKKS